MYTSIYHTNLPHSSGRFTCKTCTCNIVYCIFEIKMRSDKKNYIKDGAGEIALSHLIYPGDNEWNRAKPINC